MTYVIYFEYFLMFAIKSKIYYSWLRTCLYFQKVFLVQMISSVRELFSKFESPFLHSVWQSLNILVKCFQRARNVVVSLVAVLFRFFFQLGNLGLFELDKTKYSLIKIGRGLIEATNRELVFLIVLLNYLFFYSLAQIKQS